MTPNTGVNITPVHRNIIYVARFLTGARWCKLVTVVCSKRVDVFEGVSRNETHPYVLYIQPWRWHWPVSPSVSIQLNGSV